MSEQRIVCLPGRIPHAIPAEKLEIFLKDHPGAALYDVAPTTPAPRRRGRPAKGGKAVAP